VAKNCFRGDLAFAEETGKDQVLNFGRKLKIGEAFEAEGHRTRKAFLEDFAKKRSSGQCRLKQIDLGES
jgi:hypothetical protein